MFGSLIVWWNAVASTNDLASMSRPPLDHFDEPHEQVMAVGRPGTRLRMVLHAERRPIGARKSLVRAVEQRHMRHLRSGWQRLGVNGEPVVLAGDLHLP